MCKVVHLKNGCDVYIGRPSKWGNPFSSKDNTLAKFKVNNKKEAIEKYEEYLLDNEELFNSLYELKYKTLGCFCKPGKCHGDVLKIYVDRLETLDTSVF
jgi:hypothetical protein